MRRGNDGGLFCHILETGAIGSHLFDKYRQSSTFFQRQNRLFPSDAHPLFRFVLLRSLFFPEAKREPEKKAINPLGQHRRARPSVARTFPAKNILRGFSLKSPAGKNRKRMMEAACPMACTHPPPPDARKAGSGPPDGLRPNPTPLRFLFFGSFFSFPERKERTGEESENSRRQSSASGAPVCAARRRNSGFCDSMGSPCTHSGRNRSVQRSRLRRGRGGGGDGAAAMKRA